MSPKTKKEHLEVVARRYKKASREHKTIILNELCANLNYNRKYAIRKIHYYLSPKRKTVNQRKGPRFRYNDPQLVKALQQIWLAAYYPCSKRLKAILPEWLVHYQLKYIPLSERIQKLIYSISPATIDRILKPFRIYYKGKGRTTTKPGLLLKHHIPIQTNQWDESRPGFLGRCQVFS